MSLLRRALDQAITAEERAASQVVAVLSEAPQEMTMPDHFSTHPSSGYDAAQTALYLFKDGDLGQFSNFLNQNNLSPNIILTNGLTLLQNSLMTFPKDMARLNCLLELGANPNLFMPKKHENGFDNTSYPAAYHPLNYAFTNCPQNTTPEICATLRRYGASVDGLKNRLEVDPALAVQDDKTKAELRRSLIKMPCDLICIKKIRNDVDLSILHKEQAHVATKLETAGFQIASYTPAVQKQIVAALGPEHIGQMIDGKGIYVGKWEPIDRRRKTIGKNFHVFAAPQDLTNMSGDALMITFQKTAKEVANLKNWHGHNGGNFANDKILYNALKGRKYKGEWFIPPIELLNGHDVDGVTVRGRSTLYHLKDTGDFKDTFPTAKDSDSDHWYWSCTRPRDSLSNMWGVRFSDGKNFGINITTNNIRCRLCRVELAL